MNKIGILTSGGDSPGMNAVIRSVVYSIFHYKMECFGILNGYKGLIEGNIFKLEKKYVKNIIHNSGTILKTSRSKSFETIEGREKAYKIIKKHNINGLILIGGNGSFIGARNFCKKVVYIPIVVIPGTIDNDIDVTDLTIGYDSSLNTLRYAIDQIKKTTSSHNRFLFLEVMGRNSGFLALVSGIATGSLYIIPEIKYNIDQLFKYFQKQNKKIATLIVSEGYQDGIHELAKKTKWQFPYAEIIVYILGHIQRCGNPSCLDRVLATQLGFESVKTFRKEKKHVIIGIKNNNLLINPFEKLLKNNLNQYLLDISNLIQV